MKTLVTELDNTIRFYLKGREEPVTNSSHPDYQSENVTAVRLDYYCPTCDYPNNVVHTPPLVDGLEHECDHCESSIQITPNRSQDSVKYKPDKIEETSEKIEEKRKVRIIGENLPEKTKSRIQKLERRVEMFNTAALTTGLFSLLFFGLSSFVTYVSIEVADLVFITGMIMWLLFWLQFFIGKHVIMRVQVDRILRNVLSKSERKIVRRNCDFLTLGIAIYNDEETLYIPPSESKKEQREKVKTVTSSTN